MSRHEPPKLEATNLEATNVIGMTSLLNPQKVRGDVDLEAVESKVVGRRYKRESKPMDEVRAYDREIRDIEKSLGGFSLGPRKRGSSSGSSTASSSRGSRRRGGGGGSRTSSRSGSDYSYDSYDSGYDSEGASDRSLSSFSDKSIGSDGSVRSAGSSRSGRGDRRGRHVTEEQGRSERKRAMMEDLRKETRTSFGIERERVRDIKSCKLEQIGQLRMTLEEEGIDTSAVGNPTIDSEMADIDSVLNILKMKNDRNRYSSIADEIILGLAELIETVFDGTTTIPIINWTPDYTGYHNTVNAKLHRMRFETAQVVGSIIEKYDVSSDARIFMELAPSFFLYPRQQQKQRAAPGLHSDLSSAMLKINEADKKKNLDDIRKF
jgi:hypothetical protein